MKTVRTAIILLKPDKMQSNKLMRMSGCARVCYNMLLDYWSHIYETQQRKPTVQEMREYINEIKCTEGYEWMSDLEYHIMNSIISTVITAFTRFFKGVARHPKRHKKNRNHISFPIRCDRFKFYNGKRNIIAVPNVGRMSYKYLSKFPITSFKKATVVFDGKCWYLKIATDVEYDTGVRDGRIGIDLGYRTLATIYDGKTINMVDNIMFSQKSKKEQNLIDNVNKLVLRLKNIDRLIAEKKKSNLTSNNIDRLYRKRAKLCRRVANIQNSYLHKVSKEIVSSLPEEIVLETLDISEQKDRHGILPEKYKTTALYKFYSYIVYKAQQHGIDIILADKYYPSTKMCHRCKRLNNIGGDKTYRCSCGLVIDRDINASINLYNYGANY